jgi:hypothetical protein
MGMACLGHPRCHHLPRNPLFGVPEHTTEHWGAWYPPKSGFLAFYIPGAHDERGSCGKIVLVMRMTFLDVREGEDGFLENTHWLKGHKGTEENRKEQHFSHFFYSTIATLASAEPNGSQGWSRQVQAKKLKIPHRCHGRADNRKRGNTCQVRSEHVRRTPFHSCPLIH